MLLLYNTLITCQFPLLHASKINTTMNKMDNHQIILLRIKYLLYTNTVFYYTFNKPLLKVIIYIRP